MAFFVDVDISALSEMGKVLDKATEEAMKRAGDNLTTMTRAHIVEEAAKKLHSRRKMYVEGLTQFQLDDDTWVVNLDAKVRWIDDGMSAHNMVDDLLKSPKAKTAKDGSKYMVVPFKHNVGPASSTTAQQDLTSTIKRYMADKKMAYGSVLKDQNGKTKYGMVQKFDILDKPIKIGNGPGQGRGPIGSVKQGPTGIPLLAGVRVYQRPLPSSDGKGLVRKDVMTFRIVSSKHKGQDRWNYPGIDGVHIMDEAYQWALKTWEKEVVPGLMLEIEANF